MALERRDKNPIFVIKRQLLTKIENQGWHIYKNIFFSRKYPTKPKPPPQNPTRDKQQVITPHWPQPTTYPPTINPLEQFRNKIIWILLHSAAAFKKKTTSVSRTRYPNCVPLYVLSVIRLVYWYATIACNSTIPSNHSRSCTAMYLWTSKRSQVRRKTFQKCSTVRH